MAHHEYEKGLKPLTDEHTRQKIALYMRDMERIIPAAP
jgi:hypothetical protein